MILSLTSQYQTGQRRNSQGLMEAYYLTVDTFEDKLIETEYK